MEYIEKERDMNRRYILNGEVQRIQTEKTLLEIVPTKEFGEMIFMDGVLQLARKDEYMYHEMLVHPAMSLAFKKNTTKNICVLGGGDGCCVREIHKWNLAYTIDVYDWDKRVVELFFKDKFYEKVNIHIQDVLDISGNYRYDIIFVDLVDPDYEDNESRELWKKLIPKLPLLLSSQGILVINTGGIRPWDTKNVDWILMLLAGAFQKNETHMVEVYKTFIPSFASDWCFFMIKPIESTVNTELLDLCKFRYAGSAAWLLATTWTKDYQGYLPTKPVKLKGYLPPL